MVLHIIAVGTRMPAWVSAGFSEYAKRMPPDLPLELREVKADARGQGRTTDAMLKAEGQRIRAALPRHALLVVLDERGEDFSTMALAQRLEGWRREVQDVCLIIGGPDGIEPALKAEAQLCIRLSSLTLPHAMVRVLLAEQLYRAWTINQNHPYHRA